MTNIFAKIIIARKTLLLILPLVLIPLILCVFSQHRAVLSASTVRPTITPRPTSKPTPTPTLTPTPTQSPVKVIYHAPPSPTIKWLDCGSGHLVTDLSQCNPQNNVSSNNQNNNSNTTGSSSDQTVTCVLSYGTYQESQSDCDQLKTNDQNLQQQRQQLQNSQPTQAPQPTTNYAAQNQQCKNNALQNYQAQQQPCGQYGGSSAYDACLQTAQNNYNNAVSACNSQYPTN